MVLSPDQNQTHQLFLEVSLNVSEKMGREWLENSGFTTDHFYADGQQAAFAAASFLPTVLNETALESETTGSRRLKKLCNQRWESWKKFIVNLNSKNESAAESGSLLSKGSFQLPSDCAPALEYFAGNRQIKTSHLTETANAIDVLLNKSIPANTADWKKWVTDLNGFFFRSCQTILDLDPGSYLPIANSLAFGKGLLELPSLVSFLCSKGLLESSDAVFPSEWTNQFDVKNSAETLFPENVTENALGFMRSLFASSIEQIHDSKIDQHPDYHSESFINIYQWSQHLLDQLQFYYQNPEVYFVSQTPVATS